VNRAMHSTPISVGLFLFLISAVSQALVTPISNCTTISQPGSYVVTNNITASASNLNFLPFSGQAGCIVITSNFVTLNLGGFTIDGSGLGSTSATGVIGVGSGTYVQSGTVAKFTDRGVWLNGYGNTVEHVRAFSNAADGIVLQRPGGRVVASTAVFNGGNGISVFCPAVVLENAANSNSGTQIFETTTFGTCTNAENNPAP
jgi:hypothetical protein